MIGDIGLVLLGIAVGAFGTLIGAGGGFILVPILLLLYPGDSPELITSISLAVVFFNAASGSIAYGRMGRIDYKSGLVFALAAVPGAILGALTTQFIPRQIFNIIFGVLLLLAAIYLATRRSRERKTSHHPRPGHFVRRIVERDGTAHEYSFNLWIGIVTSALVGYLSSLLGIGGGIVHVPVMATLLDFPVHLATATSHFVLALMALTGTIVHIASGSFDHGIVMTLCLAAGVVIGAQIGARLSSRIHGDWIIRSLAVALALVGMRILAMALPASWQFWK